MSDDPIVDLAVAAAPAAEPAPKDDFVADLYSTHVADPSAIPLSDLSSFGKYMGTGPATPDGFIGGIFDALARGTRQAEVGLLDAFAKLGSTGAAEWASGLNAMMRFNQDRYSERGASFLEKGVEGTVAMAPSLLVGAAAAALSAGTATPEAAALIGTSLKAYRAAKAITAAKVFGGATMELQQYGGFIDEIHAASGGRLTTAQEHGLAMGRALTDWTIENYTFPGEAILSVGAANFGKAVVGKMLKREAGRDALELTGQSVFGFPLLGGFGRFAQSFPMEVLEEGGQRVNGNLWNAFASGDKMSLADITAGSMTDMIQSIPTVTLMSGFGAFVGGVKDEARRQTLTQGLNQPDHPVWKTVDQVLGGKADGTIDPAYVQKVEDAKAALIEMWSKTDKAAKDAPAAAEMAVQIAKKLAVEARSAGDSTASFDNYFQGMSVAFGDFSLNDLSTIHDMTVGGSTSQQVYDFMVKTNPSFSENMDTFHGAMRRLELTRENKSIRDSLKVVIADMAPASYLYGYPLEDLGRRLADAVKGLPVAKITSDTGMGFIPKEYVKAVVGNEKTAEALAVTPVKLTLGTTEGTLHVQPDGSAIFYPTLKTEKGKVKEKATAKQIAVKTAEQEAADITANAEQVEASLKAAAQERIASATPTGQTTQGNLAAKEIGLNSGLQTAPQRTLGQLVAENIYLKHRFSQMQNFRKNWNEIGAIPDTGTKGGTTPTTTPDQGTTPKLLKAVGVQQAYQEKVALDLGLTFNGVQKIPGEPDQHVYTDTQTKSTFYVPADATVEQVTSKRDEMRKKFEGTPPLAQDEGAIKGLYLSDRLLMAYFKDADAGTLLHEWTHHLTKNRLLPDSLSKVLVNSYGDDKEKKQGFLSTSRSHEAVANALLKYIRDGIPPSNVDGRIVQAFEYIKGVLKASGDQLKTYVTIQAGENAEVDGKVKVKDINVPPSVAELFSSLLSNTTATPEQMDAGHAVTESMRNNPPATPETEDAVIESINEMADEAENAPLAQAAPKKEGKAWQKIHGQFNKAALNLATKKFGYQIEKPVDLGLDSNGNHNENLYFQRLNELASDLSAQRRHKAVFRMRRTKSADTAKEGRDLAKEIKPLYEALPDSAEAQAYQFDGGPRPFTWAKLAAKKILNFDLRWFGDLRTLALHFSNGDVNHPFNQAMEGRTRDDANTITEITTKMGEKLKAAMTFNPVEAVKLGGRDWTVQNALYFYISANGQRVTQTEAELDRKSLDGTISHTEEQVLALIKSNSKVLPGNKGKVELSTINDAVDFVKADKALVNFAKLGVELSAVAKRMIDESFVQVGAKAPGTIQGMFVPRIRTDGRFDGGWIEEFVKGLQGGKNAGLSTPGSTRTRSNTIGSAINTEYVDILINYLNTMVNAAVRLPTAHTLLTMLDELQPVMEQKFGYTLRPNSNAGSQNVLFERVRDVVRQTMTTSGRLEQLGPGDIWWSKMASNTALATLAFKPWVQVISQMFSMLTGMSDIAPMKGMATYGRLMRDTLGVMGKDIRSGKITEFPLENHPIFQKLKDKSPSVIGAMSGEWEIFEAMTRRPDFVDNFVRKMGWGRNKVETYFYTMKVMDMIAKCAIFDTKYTAVKAEMMEKRMSESVAEREAVKEAERAVLNHIPMIASQNKVLFQTANPVLRAFAPFVSQIVTYHNTLVRKFITPALGAYQLAQGSEGQKALAALKTLARPGMVKNAAFLWLMPALLWNMVMRRRPPDEKELLTDILTYPLSVTPVIGDIVQSLTGSGIIRQPGPIILTDTKRGIESLQDIYQALFDDEDIDLSRTYRNLIAAPADYWALPKYFLEAPSRIADIRADFPKGERLEAAFKQFVFGGQSKPTD